MRKGMQILRLTDDEIKAVVMAALATGPKSETDLKVLLEWALRAKLDRAAFALVIADKIGLSLDEKREVVFHAREGRVT